MVSVPTLIQFLVEGDFLGFFEAIYVSAFQSSDLFYSFLILLFTTPIYIRTRSLALLCIIWILLGGFFISAVPIAGGLAVFLLAFGMAGLLLRAFVFRG